MPTVRSDVEATTYDSTDDTMKHISEVRTRILLVVRQLHLRASVHDASKLEDPEKAVFDTFTPKLATSTYGSEEYKAFLAEMAPTLDHHYAVNDHHPEHFENGVHDMDLIQITEMLCDWKAATMRHNDGDLDRSITLNAERYGYGEELTGLLRRTAANLGWL